MTDEELFATLPEITEETKREVELWFDHYIWYESARTRAQREYYCSCCRETWRIDELREETPEDRILYLSGHGDEVFCPRCGESAKLMCRGKIRSGWRYSQAFGVSVVAAAEGNPNEVWIRTYRVSTDYGSYYTKGFSHRAHVEWNERSRHRIVPGGATYWEYGYYGRQMNRQNKIYDYFKNKNWGGLPDGDCATGIYFQTPLAQTFLRYCAWDAYTKKYDTSPAKYLCAYAEHPQIEMMVKMGYSAEVRDLVTDGKKNARCINWEGKTPEKIFRMSKADFSEWRRRGGQFALRKIFATYRGHGKPWIKQVARAAGRDFHAAWEYVQKIQQKHGYFAFQKWKDYCGAAKAIGDKLDEPKRLFPEDLMAAHDEMILRKAEFDVQNKFAAQTQYQAGLDKLLPKLKRKYTASDGVYMIRVPETTREIVIEGNVLDHCVGRMDYIRRMSEGGNAIVFLRRCDAPDIPWYTIEVSNKKICQCEGARRTDGKSGYYGHLFREDMPEDAKEFLDAWEKKVCRAKEKTTNVKEIA